MPKRASELTWKEAVARRDELLRKCDDHYRAVGDDDPTTEQRKEVADFNREIEELEHKIDDNRDYQEMKSRLSDAYAQRQQELAGGGDVAHGAGGGKASRPATLGEHFTEWKGFKEWVSDLAGGNLEYGLKAISESTTVGKSPALAYDRKALIIGDTGGAATSAGALTVPDYKPLVRLPFAPLVLRDIISVGTTSSDQVTYPREVSRTVAAKVVKEATATAGASGLKPESSLVLEKVIANVKTIAHWIPATKQALSDAGQIRLLIDSFLLDGLEQVLEWNILNGDGSADYLLGIDHQPGTQYQAFVTDVLATTRKARTKVEVDGLARPTAYSMNPRDWEEIELTKDGMDRYYYGGPSILGNPRLWGLPVVTPFQQQQGQGFCADWKTVALWDREQGNIRVAEQHADFFIRNMVVILAEERLALGVFRPKAICEIDMHSGPNS
jgi:HK97 family phage major capsid protein